MIHGVVKSRTRLSDLAQHSPVLQTGTLKFRDGKGLAQLLAMILKRGWGHVAVMLSPSLELPREEP